MTMRLLERQSSLLRYLTSSDAIFGTGTERPGGPALQGIDRRLLDLEARFSHEKRMEKVAGLFPRTFELLGDARASLVRAFAEACPPFAIGRLENARQFCTFLCSGAAQDAGLPPHVHDVANCELALAMVRARGDDGSAEAEAQRHVPSGSIRRHPAVALLRCSYDVRPVFEGAGGAAHVVEADTRLAVVPASDGGDPQVFALPPPVFDLLSALDGWADRSELDRLPGAMELVTGLAQARLIEMRN
jgi:hypothetical protein